MQTKTFTLVLLWLCAGCLGERPYPCSPRSVLHLSQRPAHMFSMRLLERVAESTGGHFVFSPLSTWLQLVALAEHANGRANRELWKVTRYHKNKCFRRVLRQLLYKLESDLRSERNKTSLMIVDKFMQVRPDLRRELKNGFGIKLMELNFNDPWGSAVQVNSAINKSTDGLVPTIVYYDDFMDSSVLLMAEADFFKSLWQMPFYSAEFRVQPFYASKYQAGNVNMMNQVGLYKVTNFPRLKSTILELPCADGRVSMLIFLPDPTVWAGSVFTNLQNTTLASIFNVLKRQQPRIVNVTMPRFDIATEVDNLSELLTDMGIRRIFYPKSAELKHMSKYTLMHVSLMTQVSRIEVTEEGVSARMVAGALGHKEGTVDFVINREFAFLLVDTVTQFTLYAGVYSDPSVF